MIINIKTKNLSLTPAIEEYVMKKMSSLSRILRVAEEKGSVQVDFEVAKTTRHHNKGNVFYAEATILFDGIKVRVEKAANDIYKAITEVNNVLKMEINKQKAMRMAF